MNELSPTDSFIMGVLRGWKLQAACLNAEETRDILSATQNKLEFEAISQALQNVWDEQLLGQRHHHSSFPDRDHGYVNWQSWEDEPHDSWDGDGWWPDGGDQQWHEQWPDDEWGEWHEEPMVTPPLRQWTKRMSWQKHSAQHSRCARTEALGKLAKAQSVFNVVDHTLFEIALTDGIHPTPSARARESLPTFPTWPTTPTSSSSS